MCQDKPLGNLLVLNFTFFTNSPTGSQIDIYFWSYKYGHPNQAQATFRFEDSHSSRWLDKA